MNGFIFIPPILRYDWDEIDIFVFAVNRFFVDTQMIVKYSYKHGTCEYLINVDKRDVMIIFFGQNVFQTKNVINNRSENGQV